MSSELLRACQEYIAKSYQEKLGLGVSRSMADLAGGQTPVWRYVSSSDLTSERQLVEQDAVGLLLDPQIGILSYVLDFDGEALVQKQIKRALALRSQLATGHTYTTSADVDMRGAWRIVMHWFVTSPAEKQKWIQTMMKVRRETAFSEELSLDVIEVGSGDVAKQLDVYGFPRLLITTREVFRLRRREEITRWMSANTLVRQELVKFGTHFHERGERECAQEVIRAIEEFDAKPRELRAEGAPVGTPRSFQSVRLRHFRNFRDFTLDCGRGLVSARVVHGPNGTGKSALCEALSIAMFESSIRYMRFSDTTRERDVVGKQRSQEYIDRYLKTAHEGRSVPEIGLDGKTPTPVKLAPASDVQEIDLLLGGTILTQEATLDFAQMSSEELGVRVLRGYSDLAEHVEATIDRRVQQVVSQRQDFLRTLGLSASITKIETAYSRIARTELDRAFPRPQPAVLEWLGVARGLLRDAGGDLVEQWESWASETTRQRLCDGLARYGSEKDLLRRNTLAWVEQFNELASRSAETAEQIRSRISLGADNVEALLEQVRAWGEWLERRAASTVRLSPSGDDHLSSRLFELRAQQQQIADRGRSVRARLDHLRQVETYLRETWSREYPDECPTCGATHSQKGGIVAAVESLQSRLTAERTDLQGQYEGLRSEIRGVQSTLAELGSEECPLSVEEQGRAVEWFQWVVPERAQFEQWIQVQSRREELLASITTLRVPPPLPEVVDAEGEADRVSDAISAQFRNAERIFEAPTNWRPVKERLTKTLADIVKTHLPGTLTRLWCELVLNLTAAPWLLLERPSIAVVARRGEKRAILQVKDRLARYILNQSEIHVLGLGWFLTQYFTRGRFSHACMVMDDPAHELDQTSFRELCRLLETIVRLHRTAEHPLKLIVALHQESRAIDAARATGGMLVVLGWDQNQETKESISILPEGVAPPQPMRLFEAAPSI
jgi:hypothetical protein